MYTEFTCGKESLEAWTAILGTRQRFTETFPDGTKLASIGRVIAVVDLGEIVKVVVDTRGCGRKR